MALLALFLTLSQAAGDPVELDALEVRLRYAEAKDSFTVESDVPVQLDDGQLRVNLPAGAWTLAAAAAPIPAREQFHLFTKTFQPGEDAAIDAYLDEWRLRKYQPEIVTVGRRLRLANGRLLDNRDLTVSVKRARSLAEAESERKVLEQIPAWAWIRAERVAPGTAPVAVRNAAGDTVAQLQAPFTIRAEGAVRIARVDTGFWESRVSDQQFAAPLTLEIGPKAQLELYGRLPLENYLKGVLPAEMPPLWPAEAVKAQAVAARSEIAAHLGGKHALEGYDFCILECCRAFVGVQGRHPASDEAVRATAGEILAAGGKAVPTVFSASCGGWTENNDIAWSAPPRSVLRGVSDLRANPAPGGVRAHGYDRWIRSRPDAWCAPGNDFFRWQRRLTAEEISRAVNQRHRVGRVRSIALGERGASGRLETVRVRGSEGEAVIRKELPIRLAFGGLPSAMFIVEAEGPREAPTAFVFHGGGRGHGVGLCQFGARGRAEAGAAYREILRHYFTGATIEEARR